MSPGVQPLYQNAAAEIEKSRKMVINQTVQLLEMKNTSLPVVLANLTGQLVVIADDSKKK